MASSLIGPYKLSASNIDTLVTRTSPGAYALGRLSGENYYVDYVGRSDDDVNGRLKQWVGKYTHFKFDYFPTAKAAFEKECRLYHDFEEIGLDNDAHPACSQGTNHSCPVCGA